MFDIENITKYNTKRLTNACISIKCNRFGYIKTKEQFLEYLQRLGYCKKIVFEKEYSKKKEAHWQGYLKFNKVVYLTKLQKDLKSYDQYSIQPKKGNEAQAIMYCKKNLNDEDIDNQPIEWDEENDKERKIKLKKIVKDISDQKHQSLNEIKEKNKEINVWHEQRLNIAWEQNITEKIKKTRNLGLFCRVIWLFGESGCGKTTWTANYLYNVLKFKKEDVSIITSENSEYNERIFFYEWDENCKVLVINEVDEKFPKHNSLLKLIDKGPLKTINKRWIQNNFELIVVNSLWRPEKVFGYLGKKKSSQILRRIYDVKNKSYVLKVIANDVQLNKIKKTKTVDKFIKWYKPIVEKIKEPDYTLIKGE